MTTEADRLLNDQITRIVKMIGALYRRCPELDDLVQVARIAVAVTPVRSLHENLALAPEKALLLIHQLEQALSLIGAHGKA